MLTSEIPQKLILPKPHISWSQLQCWLSSPARYRREYFENGRKLDTKFLQFGKNIAKLIEEGKHKELLPDLETYDSPEYEIKTDIIGTYNDQLYSIPILSFLDTYDSKRNVLREFKTGKIPWTMAKVQKHDQLTFYAVGLKWKIGAIPEYCDLDWIETFEEGPVDFFRDSGKIVNVTGRVISFHREFDEREIERMEGTIVRVAWEISQAYQAYLSEIIE
jgi:hypothetical protein